MPTKAKFSKTGIGLADKPRLEFSQEVRRLCKVHHLSLQRLGEVAGVNLSNYCKTLENIPVGYGVVEATAKAIQAITGEDHTLSLFLYAGYWPQHVRPTIREQYMIGEFEPLPKWLLPLKLHELESEDQLKVAAMLHNYLDAIRRKKKSV